MFIFGMCWGGGKIEPYNLDQLFQHSHSMTMLSNRKIGSLILSKVAWNIRLHRFKNSNMVLKRLNMKNIRDAKMPSVSFILVFVF